MKISASYLCSTIGRKQFVGLTGLGLSLFVLTHMLGNLLIYVGPQAYNEYGHALVSNPLIYVAEAGLILAFLAHLCLALMLQLENWKARPAKYAVSASGAKGTDLISQTMWAQGIIIFGFLILHLLTFKFGTVYMVDYGSGEIRDLFRLMVEVFQSPIYVGGYLFTLLILGFHLSHGLKSALQTMGLNHPKYDKLLTCVSKGYALAVAAGFSSQPIYMFFFHQG